ncbi:glycosyltransferase [Luteimonas sp. Sa2BVA3]|uniref:Glycosyltransferase n=1 Tax=Luteimonas colneyensis TaxID=2762230 RepID=A0ABR8UJW5_9GAMM|nr:glycosyltransferase [Luteimonas colneyensis]MBD7988321.1 glycosyltransferase [Luteimonas colneyensis]
MSVGVLLISYTGLLEPLGQSQVLAYQENLASERPVHILSFERPIDLADRAKVEAVRRRIRAAGIHWHCLRYHKRPSTLATLWDIGWGAALGIRLARRHGLGIVHARSYVAGIMALLVKKAVGVRFLFDMRGFWVDERVDGGLWPRNGRMYRVAKWFERKLLIDADHVVSLTHAGVTEMAGFDYLQDRAPPMSVIPTCADLARFSPVADSKDEPFTLGYVGSAGTWYLFDAAVAAFGVVRRLRPDARFLIINRDAHAYIRERLDAARVPEDAVELMQASHTEVPAQMRRMHAGVFFIKPVFSKQASAPTKLAEFLGCGIPCLSNTGVGDMAQVLVGDRVGVAVDAMDPAGLESGVSALLDLCGEQDVAERCVASARRHFSLDEGVKRYRTIYEAMASG